MMTRKEALEQLKVPLPVEEGAGEPSFDAYLERLDELFGEDWEQDIQATAKGVRCEIKIDHGGFFIKRAAIGGGTIDAFKLCCYMIGLGRSQTTYL